MARNGLAGKRTGKRPSAEYLAKNPAARKKKLAYDKKYQATPKRVQYREDLNQANRKAGTYGNGDGKDMSHTKRGKMVPERQSTNRARNGRNGRSTKK